MDALPEQITLGDAEGVRVGLGFIVIVCMLVEMLAPEVAAKVMLNVPAFEKVMVLTEALGEPKVGPAGEDDQV